MQAEHELAFWQTLLNQHGSIEDYVRFRTEEYIDKTEHFPMFQEQQGRGLDLGCGLVSVLDACNKKVIACDPLMDKYLTLVPQSFLRKIHQQEDGENLTYGANFFDWVFCVNVIDHTPDPKKMSDEIHRVLKPGGILYFEVNFDDQLSPCHYDIWSKELIKETFNAEKFETLGTIEERIDQHNQSRIWIEFKKI